MLYQVRTYVFPADTDSVVFWLLFGDILVESKFNGILGENDLKIILKLFSFQPKVSFIYLIPLTYVDRICSCKNEIE